MLICSLTKEDPMLLARYSRWIVVCALALLPLCVVALTGTPSFAEQTSGKPKMKVLYHVDSKDPEVAKYALALIHKHIEAEGGPQNIDIKLVIHGPALPLFEKDKIDPELKKKFDLVLEDGACRNVPGLDEDLRKVIRGPIAWPRADSSSRGGETHRRSPIAGVPVHQAVGVNHDAHTRSSNRGKLALEPDGDIHRARVGLLRRA
jgi:Uncharacterized conserved protein